MIKLLVGLLKYENGQIILDGHPLSQIALNALYCRITYLSQDAPVFDGTIKENMVFDRDVPMKDLFMALDKVQLTSLIQSLPNGADTPIGEKPLRFPAAKNSVLPYQEYGFKIPTL